MKLSARFFCKSYNAPTLSRSIVVSGHLVWISFYARPLASVESVFSGGRVLRDSTSRTDQQVKYYIDNFQNLRRSLLEHASVSAVVMVHRVMGELEVVGRAISSFVP